MADFDVAHFRFGAKLCESRLIDVPHQEPPLAAFELAVQHRSRHRRQIGRTVAERDRQLADVRFQAPPVARRARACRRAGWPRRRPPARPRQSGGWPTAPSDPGPAMSTMLSRNSRRTSGSRPDVGSSRINSSGLCPIASDSETLARIPFERSLILRSGGNSKCSIRSL